MIRLDRNDAIYYIDPERVEVVIVCSEGRKWKIKLVLNGGNTISWSETNPNMREIDDFEPTEFDELQKLLEEKNGDRLWSFDE